MTYYKVYYRENYGWIKAHGWYRIKADSPKEAREAFKKIHGTVGIEVTRVRKDG